MCGTHLDRRVYTAKDLWDPVYQGIGSYLQSLTNKGKVSGREFKTSINPTFSNESATEPETSSQEQQRDRCLRKRDTREDRNDQ